MAKLDANAYQQVARRRASCPSLPVASRHAIGGAPDDDSAPRRHADPHVDAEIIIQMEGVDKWYGEFQVLRNINLDRAHGRADRHLRPVGLRQVDADPLHQPARGPPEGRIVVDGIELDASDRKNIDEVRREVGMVFQQFNLFPHLTVLENCTLAPIWVREHAEGGGRGRRR